MSKASWRAGEVPGLVTLVSRRVEVHVDAIGSKALGGDGLIRRDTIFRIASLTEPITAAATMILVEECTLRLDEPVDRMLSELADRKVLKRIDGPLDVTVPATRPITVRDLLTFRMGWDDHGAAGHVSHPTGRERATAHRLRTADPLTPHTPDEWISQLTTLPLMQQPGEKWMYNTGSYVLGVLIHEPRASRWRRSCANASSSRSACGTPVSACRRRSSTGWRRPTRPIPKPGRSSSTGPQGRPDRDPDDPARGLPPVLGRLSRFLDLGLPGN
jgi:hypothetical protein